MVILLEALRINCFTVKASILAARGVEVGGPSDAGPKPQGAEGPMNQVLHRCVLRF